ncbi:MAG: hydroxylamine oxidase [Deltaproteobacteria bacterium]|nr:hydroxylamine oxidase [Deltaproteobacteria bacterium]
MMKRMAQLIAVIMVCLVRLNLYGKDLNLSSETEDCLSCHSELHPGLVSSWLQSRHSKISPAEGLTKPALQSRVSSKNIPDELQQIAVGCYECHGLRTDQHQDAFEHNGYEINVIVSPADCATCHSVEAEQYAKNIMSHAYGNLVDNTLYQDFTKVVNNHYTYKDKKLTIGEGDMLTEYESCLYCHGTKVEVKGLITRDTDYGELEFPDLEGWPNQGVGRINPDGSKGACTSCHSRHAFSIEMARKPFTCSECHKGPDVPAYKVYEVSKHGNIFNSKKSEFEFNKVPWTVGVDFTAPTCAACHASLLVSPDETVVAERTHQYNDRLSWRLFGVPYAHPHPLDANLENVVNSEGLPLAVELNGEPVAKYVLSKEQQDEHNDRMKAVCLSCHSTQWVENHFLRLDNTIERTNDMTYEATKILMDVWGGSFESGLPQGQNIFDEKTERMWTTIWLFYANSTRFASAMAGGGDYGVFAKGRYQTTEQLTKLLEQLKLYHALEETN